MTNQKQVKYLKLISLLGYLLERKKEIKLSFLVKNLLIRNLKKNTKKQKPSIASCL